MQSSLASLSLSLLFVALSTQGCIDPKPIGSDRDGSTSDATSDAADDIMRDSAVRCIDSDGGAHLPGESFPAPDGCNICSCDEMGRIACTERACMSTDASTDTDGSAPRTCRQQSDCRTGERCFGPEGCGVPWTCVPSNGCTPDLGWYCTCRGVTVQGSSSCPPEPYAHRGACESTADAGPSEGGGGNTGGCMRTGCSGQLCADMPLASTCEFLPEYACYASATCERQSDGRCGWTMTPALTACLAAARDGGM
jgi:hypothetical protein